MILFERKQFLPTLIMLLFSITGFMQESSTYQGPLQVGPYIGNADYEYIISNGDTIYNGFFQLQRSSLETLLEKEDASFFFKGGFDKGTPIGVWQLQFGEYETDSQSKVVDYEYRVLISGIQEQGSGLILDGTPDGKWIYEVNRIKDSEIEKTLFKSEFIFEKGVPQQNFKVENGNTVMVGRFLRNGLAQDEWSSFDAEAIDDTESWYFEDGVLHKIIFVKEGVTNDQEVFKDFKGVLKEIHLDDSYIELVRATLNSDDAFLNLKNGISGLLRQNAYYYAKVDTVFSQLGAPGFAPKFKVKVPHYPLDSLQQGHLNTISKDFEAASAISEALLNNSHLNIVKRSDSDALFNYKATELITEQYLKPLERLIEYRGQRILQHMNVPKLIQNLWPNGKPEKKFEIAMEGTTASRIFELPEAENFNYDTNDLGSLSQLASYAKRSLDYIKESLSDQLTNEQNLQTLNDLEEDLIAINESLVQQKDSVINQLPKSYKNALNQITSLADTSLSQYAAIKNPSEKLQFGNTLKKCLEQLKLLSAEIIDLPSKIDEIRALYQDSIWNPFMATVMDEEVKKRMTTAYTKILVPYYLESVNTGLDCENATKLTNQMIHTNKRMIELREADTRKLERKLRKEKDPNEILQLLHQAITPKAGKNEK